MKILVTGAAGFLGSHLCDYLLEQGHSVTGIDNYITGQRSNLAPAIKNKRFKLVEGDICKTLPSGGFDWVFNSASIASPVHYYAHPVETLLVGSTGLFNCLELARKANARLVHFSTSEVYGDPLEHPQKESYWGNVNPIGPRSCYDESKRFGEALCKAFERTYSLDIRIGRIFNTYGSRMAINDGRLIPELTMQALTGKPLTVYGDGSQTRSFCYVDDLVKGIYRLMEKDGLKGEVVNLGNPDEFTVIGFAELLLKITGSKSKIAFVPPKLGWHQDDPHRRQPDITKAKKLLGWRPSVPLHEGMKQTIGYFQQLIS